MCMCVWRCSTPGVHITRRLNSVSSELKVTHLSLLQNVDGVRPHGCLFEICSMNIVHQSRDMSKNLIMSSPPSKQLSGTAIQKKTQQRDRFKKHQNNSALIGSDFDTKRIPPILFLLHAGFFCQFLLQNESRAYSVIYIYVCNLK